MKTKRIISSFMAVVILCCSLISGVNVQAKTDEWPKGPSKSSFVSGSAIVVEVSWRERRGACACTRAV